MAQAEHFPAASLAKDLAPATMMSVKKQAREIRAGKPKKRSPLFKKVLSAPADVQTSSATESLVPAPPAVQSELKTSSRAPGELKLFRKVSRLIDVNRCTNIRKVRSLRDTAVRRTASTESVHVVKQSIVKSQDKSLEQAWSDMAAPISRPKEGPRRSTNLVPDVLAFLKTQGKNGDS